MTWQKTVMTPGINAIADNVCVTTHCLQKRMRSLHKWLQVKRGTIRQRQVQQPPLLQTVKLQALAAEVSAASLVNKYLDVAATDPTVGKNGAALEDGNWYVNTVSGLQRIYTVAHGWKTAFQ